MKSHPEAGAAEPFGLPVADRSAVSLDERPNDAETEARARSRRIETVLTTRDPQGRLCLSAVSPTLRPQKRADVELTGLTRDIDLPPVRASKRGLALAIALLMGVATGCSDDAGPAREWETIWGNTIKAVTQGGTSGLTEDQCQDLLGYLRVQRTVVTPVPLDDLEGPVDRWFAEAESLVFECELDREAARDSLVTLDAIEAEIEAVLEVEQ